MQIDKQFMEIEQTFKSSKNLVAEYAHTWSFCKIRKQNHFAEFSPLAGIRQRGFFLRNVISLE